MECQDRGSTTAAPLRVGMPLPGDVIAEKYRIESVLGRGGMSVVYRATHLQLDQQVAIKVLSAEALMMPEYVIRLKREARAVSRIRSEHVVRVHDIGELTPGGVPYLVMECLAGADLAAVLALRGPLPVPLAVECIMHACEALAEAHALGIVHRDLKPANLFLTEAVDGSPCLKVLDFGISRMAPKHGVSSLTDPGTVLGTPSYMAPEQMEAATTVDARADIWALGTILYELLVGRPPYQGETLPKIFVKIMRASSAPKPSAACPDVPQEIDAVVARCLEVDVADRYQTVAELGWALSEIGTPHARDSAERISRVFDKHSEGGAASGTLRSSVVMSAVPPAVTPSERAVRRRARRRHAWWSRLNNGNAMAACASVALVVAMTMFGAMTVRGRNLPVTHEGAVDVGAVVVIRPIVRPADDGTDSDARLAALDAPRAAEPATGLAATSLTGPAGATHTLASISLAAPAAKGAKHEEPSLPSLPTAAAREPLATDGGSPPPAEAMPLVDAPAPAEPSPGAAGAGAGAE